MLHLTCCTPVPEFEWSPILAVLQIQKRVVIVILHQIQPHSKHTVQRPILPHSTFISCTTEDVDCPGDFDPRPGLTNTRGSRFLDSWLVSLEPSAGVLTSCKNAGIGILRAKAR